MSELPSAVWWYLRLGAWSLTEETLGYNILRLNFGLARADSGLTLVIWVMAGYRVERQRNAKWRYLKSNQRIQKDVRDLKKRLLQLGCWSFGTGRGLISVHLVIYPYSIMLNHHSWQKNPHLTNLWNSLHLCVWRPSAKPRRQMIAFSADVLMWLICAQFEQWWHFTKWNETGLILQN